jgi:hypothetical protein
MPFENSGRAVIEDGSIVVRVAIGALDAILEGAWRCGIFQDRWRATDPAKLAEGVVRELNAESENGTTRIHKLFDAAILEAIDQGVEGIEQQGSGESH